MRISDWSSDVCSSDLYGLTKGQYSPTSRIGTRSPSTPTGSIDRPLSPCLFALGAGARSIARPIDPAQKHLPVMLARAHAHRTEERSVGKEWVRTCGSRGSPYH